MKKKSGIIRLIIVSIVIIMVKVWGYDDSSSPVSQSPSYIFVKKWGTEGEGDGQFGGIYWASGTTFIITDEVIENLKDKIDDEKLKILETMKDKKFNKHDADELSSILYDLKFTGIEIYMIQKASALKKLSDYEIADGLCNRLDKIVNGPLYIALDKSDNVYVSDFYNNIIQKFDSDGRFIVKWYGVAYPYGITVDLAGYIYVVDNQSHRIQKFDSDGRFILKWGSEGLSDSQFYDPTGIVADSEGYIYVLDYSTAFEFNHEFPIKSCLKKFDSNGNFIMKMFVTVPNVNAITIDPMNHIFLANCDNGLSDIFKYKLIESELLIKGDLYSLLVKNEEWHLYKENIEFKGRVKLVIDSESNLFVLDKKGSCVYKFNPDGKLLTKWGSFGSNEGQFNRPEAIAVDSKGNVYVMDTGNYRIQKFAPKMKEDS